MTTIWMKRIALITTFVLCLNVTACGKKEQVPEDTSLENTTSEQESSTSIDPTEEVSPIDVHDSLLTPDDAAALVAEKIPSGSRALVTTAFDTNTANDYHNYFVITVTDAYGMEICKVAVDGKSGKLHHYMGGKNIQDFSKSPLYDPERDREIVWFGSFTAKTITLQTSQAEDGSLAFTFSNGTTGTAVLSGNAAIASLTNNETETCDTVVFINNGESYTVGGSISKICGTYSLEEEATLDASLISEE